MSTNSTSIEMPALFASPALQEQLQNPTYTFSYSKYSCIVGFYWAHVVFAYIIMVAGAGALVTRVIPRAHVAHAWFGRLYILSMLWATATSLLIHNTGLPEAVLWSFLWVMAGLTIGWIIIVVHRERGAAAALAAVGDAVRKDGALPAGGLGAAVAAEQARQAAAKGFVRRFFSLKALHGMLMFTSWLNIIGRIFATKLDGGFTCETYPVYKAIDGEALSFVPVDNPNYDSLPWASTGMLGWSLALSLGPMAFAAVVGAGYSWIAARRAARTTASLGPAQAPLGLAVS